MQIRQDILATRMEVLKLLKRKDSWLLLTMIFVPFLYAFGLANNSKVVSYSGLGNVDAMNFVAMMFVMMHSMIIFNVILAANTSKSMATEIENKSLLLYLNRIGDRDSIYKGKAKAMNLYIFIMSASFIVISVLLYYGVLITRNDIVNGIFCNTDFLLIQIMQIASVILSLVITSRFVLLLSTYFKLVTTIVIYMVSCVLMDLLSYVKVFQYLSPVYYIERFQMDDKITYIEVLNLILYGIIVVLCLDFIGKRNFKKKDL